MQYRSYFSFFFFNDTATTEIYTLSLHDALPIFGPGVLTDRETRLSRPDLLLILFRSEERFSRNAETDIVCRLLLEKNKLATSHRLPHPGRIHPHPAPAAAPTLA